MHNSQMHIRQAASAECTGLIRRFLTPVNAKNFAYHIQIFPSLTKHRNLQNASPTYITKDSSKTSPATIAFKR